MELAKSLDYRIGSATRPSYKFTKLFKNDGVTDITLTAAGGNETIVEIPAVCYNLAKSYIEFTLTPATSGANNFNYINKIGVPHIQQVQLYNRQGQFVCDLMRANDWMNTCLPYKTKNVDLANQPSCVAGAGYITGMEPSNVAKADNYRLDGTTADRSFTEVLYLEDGATANSATPVQNYRIPLSIFKGTIFEVDKDLYFGQQMLLRIVWAPMNTGLFYSTTANSVGTAVAYAGASVVLSGYFLYLATEKNQAICNDLISKVNTSGLRILTPYTWSFQTSLSTVAQAFIIRVNRSHGLKLRKIWVAPYGVQATNTRFDHSNVAAAKLVSFYTTVDSTRTTDANITAISDGYKMLQEKLMGGCATTLSQYLYNYIWVEDFTDEERLVESNYDVSAGRSLDVEMEYAFNATTANVTNIWNVFLECERSLTITREGVILQ